MEHNGTDWKELVFRGVESDELDYKAAQNWDELPKSGRAKLAGSPLASFATKYAGKKSFRTSSIICTTSFKSGKIKSLSNAVADSAP